MKQELMKQELEMVNGGFYSDEFVDKDAVKEAEELLRRELEKAVQAVSLSKKVVCDEFVK